MIKRYINKTIYHPFEYENARAIGDGNNILPIALDSSGFRTLEMTPQQFTQITSALYVGTRISYPDEHGELLDVWLDEKQIDTAPQNCFTIPAWSSALEYFYNDPYLQGSEFNENVVLKWITFQDIVDIFPQWLQDVYNLFGGVDRLDLRLGYRNDDVFFLPASTFDNILSPFDFTNGVLAFPQQFLPSIVLRFRGEGTVKANVLSTPAGGSVIGVVDRPFSLQDTLNAINTGDFTALTGFQSAELQRDIIQFPPETVAEVSLSWDITGDTTHVIELFYIPRFNDSLEFLGFGGGFRNFEVCDGITLIDDQGNDILRSQHNAPRQGYLSTTRRQLDEAIKESEPIQLVQANVERSNDINAGLYGFAADIFDKLDSSNPDSFTPALVWERRYSQAFRDNEPINIPIEAGYKAFRLVIIVNSADNLPRYLYAYLNGDFTNTNYVGHQTTGNADIDNPVVGVSNHRNGTSTPHIVATMYDYGSSSIQKVMLGQGYGVSSNFAGREQGGYAYYWKNNDAVTSVDLVVSGINYQILDVEVHYLQEELVMRSQDLGLKPPPPAELENVVTLPELLLLTFEPEDDGKYTIDNGVINANVGNAAPCIYNAIAATGNCVAGIIIDFPQPVTIVSLSFQTFHTSNQSTRTHESRAIFRTRDDQNVPIDSGSKDRRPEPFLQWHDNNFIPQGSGVSRLEIDAQVYANEFPNFTANLECRLDNVVVEYTID